MQMWKGLKMADVLEFSLVLRTREIVLKDEDDLKSNYTLKELIGEGRDVWLEFVRSRMTVRDGKVQDVSSLKGLQAELVSMCLFDSNDMPVGREAIQKYPAHVLTALFETAQELSDLNEEPKNV